MIQPFFNGMLAILLAKFFINDLPHAAGLTGSDYERKPTTGQLRYIAALCQQLKMPIPYEEQVRTFGEAGRMIRELEAEREYRKKQKQLGTKRRRPPPGRTGTPFPARVKPSPVGSPAKKALPVPVGTNFRIERTTTDKVLDDLERTWHRIESDMSVRMQSALGILKEVMGYYYEEPCIVVWDNSNLVGIAVYETYFDKDKGIQDTHIKELASFTHTPGVGRLLVEEVIRIGREESSDIVSASYGPGARGFYEGLGFVKDVYYPEEATLVMYRLKSSNPSSARLSRAEFENLPIAHRGFDPEKPEPDIMHVTPDVDIARSHGRYLMTGRVLPGKLIPDPEIEGYEARKLTGIESFNLGSATIPKEYYWPDSEAGKREYERCRQLKGGNPGIATPVVGFTGTRRGMTPSQKAEVKSTLISLQPRLVRHGDCVGADAEFHAISIELGIPVWLHPCTISGQRAYSQGAIGSEPPKEPLERNRDIVNISDVLIAAPGESVEVLRSGTWATIRYARKIGRELIMIYPGGTHVGSNPANYYRIFIPVESASVSPGSLYWRSAEFRFEGAFIQTTYTEIAQTPRAASMKYIYSLPEKDVPTEVYAENIKDSSDNGRYSGPQLKEEIVQGVAAEGYGFIKRLKGGYI